MRAGISQSVTHRKEGEWGSVAFYIYDCEKNLSQHTRLIENRGSAKETDQVFAERSVECV
jgi:hypothetical protein